MEEQLVVGCTKKERNSLTNNLSPLEKILSSVLRVLCEICTTATCIDPTTSRTDAPTLLTHFCNGLRRSPGFVGSLVSDIYSHDE